ncbi:hypothetical protein DN752_05585 [Echinicola strongylocentroti]|uniref:Uncharacterized protein n=1 Tax=Echinicola strongylocentroti TaxID=1795355 RepID=A0A2Z4IFA8_9BACT|nr:hypothetical protein [Echinicola strongylocentroti]AWW29634.1 hypothetical protein DN752_05585 [Echinicola strongylocentroti]
MDTHKILKPGLYQLMPLLFQYLPGQAAAIPNVLTGVKWQRHDEFSNLRIHPQDVKHSSSSRRSASGTDDSCPTRNPTCAEKVDLIEITKDYFDLQKLFRSLKDSSESPL